MDVIYAAALAVATTIGALLLLFAALVILGVVFGGIPLILFMTHHYIAGGIFVAVSLLVDSFLAGVFRELLTEKE